MQLDIVSQKLDIIFLTDLHLQQEQVRKLAKQTMSQQWHFDYCLVGGDIANIDNSADNQDQQAQFKSTQEMLALLFDLFQCKVIFIPGNHDSLHYFNGQHQVSPDIINIHKKQHVLEVGLSIVGLGGSSPGYSDPERTKICWDGFPYKTEEEYKKDVESVFKQEDLHISKIYLTHMGPAISNTTLARRGETVYAGSTSLDSLLEDKNLLALLHGHVHNGGKYDMYQGKPIINPGAFLEGQYTTFRLNRVQKEWKLSKISFNKLL